ncbi:LytTR family transcriptional regulator DNA-binding domain-containing protein [Pediococcus pentosaceus]|uniref:LytR/AlgR family response regulator transcription factor n=1 Tax=Pediococcus pentosaceus TaxID=1255 RepID=UPI0018A17EB2|nr:LytTR family transcriptional regulator DNA-binding domain-containing protein [Pediococcus pentosaceus]MBF7122946.1 LytTR family transcriptional regulator DNA-binding domain-containing protein [Pediococcus pentosaceus]MCR1860512.1 LytTR family transcriptional regulator DNA-binding domain-containing protein [Pediococcus pentosaceus]
MKILIVDDEPLARSELDFLLRNNPLVDSVSEAEGVTEAKQKLMTDQPDLMFLDIRLDDGNGMTFAKFLKKEEKLRPYIVFATAYDQYALDAFDVNATDYILKPFEKDRIDETLKRVDRILKKPESLVNSDMCKNPRLSVTVDERTIIIKKSDILYLEAQNGNVLIYTKNLLLITSKQTLINLEKQLDPEQFLRVHRSFLVNLDMILEFQPSFNHTYELTLINGTKITVSRSYVAKTKKVLGIG